MSKLYTYDLSNTGIGLRSHDPAYEVNAAVPPGQIGLSLDTGYRRTGSEIDGTNGKTVLLTGSPKALLKTLDDLTKTLRSIIATPR